MRSVVARLSELDGFAPSRGFADRVMANVRAPVPAPTRLAVARAALSRVTGLLPRSRKAWAAIGGVALTPAVSFGLVLYVVFSHPTVTLSGLGSFATWQLSDLAVAAWGEAVGLGLQATRALGVDGLFAGLADAPLLAALGGLAYAVALVLALRTLYRNLGPSGGRRQYAHVTTS